MSELKPCPHCGPDRSVCEVANHYTLSQVACGACGSSSGLCKTEADAIALWNTRADSLAIAAAVQAEREACAQIVETTDSIVRLHIARLIRSRGPAPAVDVLAVVREYVEARRESEDCDGMTDAIGDRYFKALAALSALVDGAAAKGEGEGR